MLDKTLTSIIKDIDAIDLNSITLDEDFPAIIEMREKIGKIRVFTTKVLTLLTEGSL